MLGDIPTLDAAVQFPPGMRGRGGWLEGRWAHTARA